MPSHHDAAGTTSGGPEPLIRVPHFPPGMVARDDLLSRIDAGVPAPDCATVVLLRAPVGYGKTTLASQWAVRHREAGDVVAWVGCSPQEQDEDAILSALLASLVAAFGSDEAGHPQADRVAHRLAQLAPPTREGLPSLRAAMADALADHSGAVGIVLDDLHEVGGQRTLAALAELVSGLPSTVTVLMCSRHDHPHLTTELRLRTRLVELHANDLAFTQSHLRDLVAGRPDADALVARLVAATDGWPAAVRLLVQTAQPHMSAPLDPLDTATLHDFVWNGVVAPLGEDDQQFLLYTCVAPEMNAALAHALTGRTDAGTILERFFRTQVLVSRTGGDDPWYVLHALLRSCLLAHAVRRDIAALPAQHRRAAWWWEANGRPHLALDHAVAAGDIETARRLLVTRGLAMLDAGQSARVRNASAWFPRDAVDADLRALAVIAALDDGDPAPPALAAPVAEPTAADRAARVPTLPRLAQFSLFRVRGEGDTRQATTLFPDLMAWEPPPDLDEREVDAALVMLMQRGKLAAVTSDFDRATGDLTRALDLAELHRRDLMTLQCLGTSAAVHSFRGEHADSRRRVERQLPVVEARGWRTHPAVTHLYLVGSWAAHNMLDVDQARTWCDVAMRSAAASGDPAYSASVRFLQSVLAIDHATDRETAADTLAELTALAASGASPRLRSYAPLRDIGTYHEMLMRRAMRDGPGLTQAMRRIAQAHPGLAEPRVVRALVLLDGGDAGRARSVVRPVTGGLVAPRLRDTLTTALIVEACAAEALGDASARRRWLQRAVTDAAPRGAARPFYDVGPTCLDLLRHMLGRFGDDEAFVELLLVRAARVDEVRREHGAPHPPSVPPNLTRREREVLHDLPTLMTAEEIAAEHGVSVTTIRTHMRTLYRKLDVSSRREAVRTARAWGLIG